MRRCATAVVLVMLACSALADEGGGLPTEVGASVKAAALAHAAGAATRFEAIAVRDQPDPWLVAEGLWVAGAREAAEALARLQPRPSTVGLGVYLEGRAKAPVADTVEAIAKDYGAVRVAMAKAHFKEALPALGSLAKRTRRIGWRRRLDSVLHLQGMAHRHANELPQVVAPWQERIALLAALGRFDRLAAAVNNLLLILLPLDRMADGEAIHAKALATLPKTEVGVPRIHLLHVLARLYINGGQPKRALAPCTEALRLARELGRQDILFDQVLAVGQVHQETTDYAPARERFDEAYAIASTLGDNVRMAKVQTQLGYVALGVANSERARKHLLKALTLFRKGGSKRDIGMACVNASNVVGGEEGLVLLEEAVLLLEEVGDDRNLSRALASIPVALDKLERAREARPYLERALVLAERMRDIPGIFGIHRSLAHMARLEGDPAQALRHLKAAAQAVEKDGNWAQRVLILGSLVDHHRMAGDHALAVALASRAVVWVHEAARGHADRDAATVRTRFAHAFSAGALSAHAEGDHEALLTFLESGRALLLRESLASGWVSHEATIPTELLEAEVAARKAVVQAHTALAKARSRRLRAAIRKASKQLEVRRAAYAAAMDGVRRALRKDSEALAPSTTKVAALRAALPVGSTLIIVGASVAPLPCVALVVRREGTESIELPPTKALAEAVGKIGLSAPTTLSESALAELATLIVGPLKLRPTDKRLLISPAGALSSVPWSLLVPKRGVLFTPSATVWLRQLARPPLRATHVLGLGDPDYSQHADSARRTEYQQRGGALTRLPFTRMEVNTVADVRLLRKEATETRLASALLKHDAWRAVHFACHGLLDDKDVMGSSLALTADEENDGVLTVREVYRLVLRAQLVTLSACDSGRGEVIQGAGMLGLAQAFMVAGASAVLCSLWRVDDEATRALMVEFYRLWGAKTKDGARRDAVTALRAAQVFVKTHPKHPEWKHPSYWAAWVLWGSPD